MNWTASQKKAIEYKGSNLLVAAGAGSGKTAVLVERLISRVLDSKEPADIDRFLVLTFTKAAASEMKGKIAKRISQKLAEDPDNTHLQRQMTLIHRSHINTIHAFCNELVKENFHKLGLSSDFRTADETELLLIKSDVARRILDEAYEKEDNAPFEQLLNLFTEARNDETAAQMVIEIYEKLSASPYPERLLDQMEKSFRVDPTCDLKDTPWGKQILFSCLEEVSYYEKIIERQAELLREEESLQKAYGPAFLSDRQQLAGVKEGLDSESYDEVCRIFSGLSFEKLGAARGFSSHPSAVEAKEARKMVKEGLEKMQKSFFSLPSVMWLEDIAAMAPAVSSLCDLIRNFGAGFAEEKRKRNIIDFSDQEHFALALLTDQENTALIEQIQNKYIEILVDEYQDTNQVQEHIFLAVSGKKNNVFMVGDVKQSIYRFRQACPAIFLHKYLAYGEDLAGQGDKKVCLFDNFRSRRGILDFINDLFGCIMSQRLGEIDYNEREFLSYGQIYPSDETEDEPKVEVLLLDQSKQEEEEGEEEKEESTQPIEQEAALVAQRIRRLMEDKTLIYDTRMGKTRPLQYRDIVVLMRSVASKAPIYEDVLSSFGIPVYSDAAQSYFDTTEILIMFSLLRIIDNPLQDVPLVCVLRSGIFSFTEDEIYAIRSAWEEGSLFDAVRFCAKEGDEKCRRFVETIGRYRQKGADVTVDQLIWFLYEDTRFFDLCGAMANGKLRQANLRMLFEYARKFEQTSYKGLYNFIDFVNRLVEREGEFLPAKIISENSDVVRIMSIHKSKGLEFPVCFVCETGARFNYSDIRTGMIFHEKLGFGPQFKDIERKITYPTIAKGALGLALEEEMLCEEMRILYVALTRAKERLIITGRVKNAEGKMLQIRAAGTKQNGKIHPSALIKNASYLEWLLFFLDRHPDGAPLRQMLGEGEGEWETYLSRAFVCLLTSPSLSGAAEKPREEEVKSAESAEDFYDTLRRRILYQYPFGLLSTTPAKVSVTEIKGRQIEEELVEATDTRSRFVPVTFTEPGFMKEETAISPARRGTAIHLLMQYIDYDRVHTIGEIEEQIEELIRGGYLQQADAMAISPGQILGFFNSELAARIRRGKRVWREEKFNLAVSRGILFAKSQKADMDEKKVLVQGIIDCFWEEKDGQAVIIDFKTDKLSAKDYPVLLSRYQVQMELYRRAVREIYQLPVKDCYIYLFHTGETVKISS